MKILKKWFKPLLVLVGGFLAGLIGALVALNMVNVQTGNSTNSSGAVTSNVSYKNTTDTTEAVSKVQEAVVSVINYRTQSNNSTDFYMQMFGGGEDGQESSNELSVYSEGSGVIYKVDGN